jgi:glycosyltransferase involved in cell wall biosynthesis
MRNESSNVERKLSSIINEILPHDFVELIVADSDSSDGTGEIASKFLEVSELERTRWKIRSFSIRGKNVALNRVLDEVEADIVVISDADANVSPGWLKIVRSRMMEEDVGVVSGVEIQRSSEDGFNEYYRGKSNWLRIRESMIDSTPVLEGSILAWKTSALGRFILNEEMNADDAQIGIFSIRSGNRSIVDDRITFEDFERSLKRTLLESIRRSQGLSIALIKNADLAIINPRKKSRRAIRNALFLYVIFPWILLLFTLNAMVSFYSSPEIGNNWEFFSVVSIIVTLVAPQGRFLAWGSVISIVAHTQAMIGIRYNNWDPVR